MSWAEKKIEEYKQGKDATWEEKRMLEIANPVNSIAQAVSLIVLVYGLWMHDFKWIIVSVAVSLMGFLYAWLKK